MRASIGLSVAATMIFAGVAASGPAFAKGGGHGHSASHAAPAPGARSAPAKPAAVVRSQSTAKLTAIPSKPKGASGPHKRRRAIVTPYYEAMPTCVQILPSGKRVRVRCSTEVVW